MEETTQAPVTINFSENRITRAVGDILNYFLSRQEMSADEQLKAITKASFLLANRVQYSKLKEFED